MDKKELLGTMLVERLNKGKSIKYNDFKKEDSSLLYKIEKVFGGISSCAQYMGISKEELISKYGMGAQIYGKSLDDNEIKQRLYYLKSIGKLNTNNMRIQFDDLRLEYSLKKKYGSVKKALEFYNLERDTVVVTLNGLEKEIKKLHSQNYDLTYKNMLETKSKLLSNATNKFNMGWYTVLSSMGIQYEPLHVVKYTKQMVIDKLKIIQEKEGSISYGILRNKYSGILSFVRTYYDSIYSFYEDFGYDPVELMDFETQRVKGYLFEMTFNEILKELNIENIHNKALKGTNLRPDFLLKDGTIIDCKLSSWTETIESSFNKYKNYSDNIIIVHLRGKSEYCKFKNENFKIIHVNEYLNLLSLEKKEYFKGKLEYILKNEYQLETVTTERTTLKINEITV